MFALPNFPLNRNLQNPYVINSAYFSNVTQFDYHSSILGNLHFALNLIASIIGLFLTLFVVFLIGWRTPKQFQAYSKMLLLCAVVDLCYLFGDFWCQARMRVAGGCILFSFTGPASLFSYKYQCLFMVIQAFPPILACAILPVQYAYRWNVVKNRDPPTSKRIFLYFLMAIFPTLITCICVVPIFLNQTGKDLNFDYAEFWFVEKEVPVLVIGSMSHPVTIFAALYTFALIIFSYFLSFYFAHLTLKNMKENAEYLSDRTKLMQKQFSRTLFVQSITPALTSFIPLCLTISSLILKLDTGYIGEYVIMSLTWTPVVNSLSTLILINPYRRFCLKLLGLASGKVYSVSNNVQVANFVNNEATSNTNQRTN